MIKTDHITEISESERADPMANASAVQTSRRFRYQRLLNYARPLSIQDDLRIPSEDASASAALLSESRAAVKSRRSSSLGRDREVKEAEEGVSRQAIAKPNKPREDVRINLSLPIREATATFVEYEIISSFRENWRTAI
jgi:hypothetical protein